MPDFVVCDTTVVSYLSGASRYSQAYRRLLADKSIAISFQTEAELLAVHYVPERQRNLEQLVRGALKLPHSSLTSRWYAFVAELRRELRRRGESGGDPADADVWIISSALEYEIPLMTHDSKQLHLARIAGLETLTSLESVR